MQAFREMPFVTGLEGFLDINCVTTYVYAVWNVFTSGSCAKKKGLKLAGKIAYFVNFFLFSAEKGYFFYNFFYVIDEVAWNCVLKDKSGAWRCI